MAHLAVGGSHRNRPERQGDQRDKQHTEVAVTQQPHLPLCQRERRANCVHLRFGRLISVTGECTGSTALCCRSQPLLQGYIHLVKAMETGDTCEKSQVKSVKTQLSMV